MTRKFWKWLSFLFPVGILVSCSTTSVETQERSNGQHIHRIQCRDVVSRCYDQATDLCPDGYLILSRVRGIKRDGYTEYNLSVRCRGGRVYL